MPVQIRKVESRADFKHFFEFPWRVYKDDPFWIPPLPSMRRDVIDKKHSAAWEYLQGDYFLAWRGDEVVGTIAAFINPRHNEFRKENVCFFGAFEVYNDPEAASALLQTAINWGRERGIPVIRGPLTFTVHEEIGLLIDGFDFPRILMTYNPPYYRGLVESEGFTKHDDIFSFYMDWKMGDESRLFDRIAKLEERLLRRGRIKIRPIDRGEIKREFRMFSEIYNEAWLANSGHTPLTERELESMVKSLGVIFDPNLACFAEVDGEIAGFMITVPDFNQILRIVRPQPNVPEIFSLLQIAWHWKVRPKLTLYRLPLLGVREQHRKLGLDMLMVAYLVRYLRPLGTCEAVDGGWVLESNPAMAKLLEGIGMSTYRTYRLYERSTGV